jgi:hypothetical protein
MAARWSVGAGGSAAIAAQSGRLNAIAFDINPIHVLELLMLPPVVSLRNRLLNECTREDAAAPDQPRFDRDVRRTAVQRGGSRAGKQQFFLEV